MPCQTWVFLIWVKKKLVRNSQIIQLIFFFFFFACYPGKTWESRDIFQKTSWLWQLECLCLPGMSMSICIWSHFCNFLGTSERQNSAPCQWQSTVLHNSCELNKTATIRERRKPRDRMAYRCKTPGNRSTSLCWTWWERQWYFFPGEQSASRHTGDRCCTSLDIPGIQTASNLSWPPVAHRNRLGLYNIAYIHSKMHTNIFLTKHEKFFRSNNGTCNAPAKLASYPFDQRPGNIERESSDAQGQNTWKTKNTYWNSSWLHNSRKGSCKCSRLCWMSWVYKSQCCMDCWSTPKSLLKCVGSDGFILQILSKHNPLCICRRLNAKIGKITSVQQQKCFTVACRACKSTCALATVVLLGVAN